MSSISPNPTPRENLLDLDPITFIPCHYHYNSAHGRCFHSVCLKIVSAIGNVAIRNRIKKRLISSVYAYYYSPRETWGKYWMQLKHILVEECDALAVDPPEWLIYVNRLFNGTDSLETSQT